ncbi:putative baseplate J-like protein [Clostridium baratii]|uniref:baseplate J/gp47 family protein n=1 Tax=Clostridium baratii TaxID=1561 RepID=UPI0006C0EB43|nr:baseplate J/gp47 family protein [Clostridium baratii]CUO92030.1 putative baseplate J-like protein [Clostridium baratii]
MSLGEYLEEYSFENLIKGALEKVPDDIDKRQGSVIYDALAPACYQLAEMYMQLKEVLLNSFVTTSYGEYLDNKVIEQGLTRYKATYAKKKIKCTFENGTPATIQVGSRFSTINDETPLTYKVIDLFKNENNMVVPGEYIVQCETIGTIGNGYIGDMLPITHINNLKSCKMTTLLVPARDEESDEELKQRFILEVNQRPFGGNVAQYDDEIRKIDGIGEVQIYPTWNGGGTVKCSIVDTEFNAVSEELIEKVKNIIDPKENEGTGLGLAPIGHIVTITTPQVVNINIEAKIHLITGYTIDQVREEIKKSIESYLKELKKNWGIADEMNRYELSIYVAQITMSILKVVGVANVTNIKINGQPNDLKLIQSGEIQQLPKLAEVTLL